MSKRRRGRELALQMLYQLELGGASPREVLSSGGLAASTGVEERNGGAFEYAEALFRGTVDHRETIDALIREQAEHWRLERMPAVDRNILRLAVFEFLHEPEVPKLVVINEAIELAKRFGSADSGRFINGLLDGLLKRHSFEGSLT
jgi:N utilization substance protein B